MCACVFEFPTLSGNRSRSGIPSCLFYVRITISHNKLTASLISSTNCLRIVYHSPGAEWEIQINTLSGPRERRRKRVHRQGQVQQMHSIGRDDDVGEKTKTADLLPLCCNALPQSSSSPFSIIDGQMARRDSPSPITQQLAPTTLPSRSLFLLVCFVAK